MEFNHDYVAQAEQNIYSKEEQRAVDESIVFVKNLQYQFEQEGFGLLREDQAMLLNIKRDKLPRINTDLGLIQREIERIEAGLGELLNRRRQCQIELMEARKDLANYENKLKAQSKEDEELEAYYEMEWERAMGSDYGF